MEVCLLGTGGADGWPNPWCRCESCEDARARRVARTQTCTLIDGKLLVDVGPSLAGQAGRAGVSLAGVHTVLVTHAHTDHLDAPFVWHRVWADADPVVVAGPSPVIDVCRTWLAPDQTSVTLAELTAGTEVNLGGYRVVALPANHWAFGECLLYAIEAPDGKRLLYATDTGEWVTDAADLLRGWRFDAVLMEQTFGNRTDLGDQHLGLVTFGSELEWLRELGCVDDSTQVVAVHLSHHNPVERELLPRLRQMGVEAFPDGTLLQV